MKTSKWTIHKLRPISCTEQHCWYCDLLNNIVDIVTYWTTLFILWPTEQHWWYCDLLNNIVHIVTYWTTMFILWPTEQQCSYCDYSYWTTFIKFWPTELFINFKIKKEKCLVKGESFPLGTILYTQNWYGVWRGLSCLAKTIIMGEDFYRGEATNKNC